MQNEEYSIFVGNLHEKVTEDLLYELFLQAGPLEEVRIPTVNGVSRNFGFVVYKHEKSVPYAISLLDKIILYDRALTLNDANSKHRFAPRGPVKDRLGPTITFDSSSLRAAPGFAGRRYNDSSMQPTKSSRNKEWCAQDIRNQNSWSKPGSMNLYPSQNEDLLMPKRYSDRNHSTNDHFKHHGNRNDPRAFSHSRRPYEKKSHERDNHRYGYKHYRRSM